jgi:hypothetical protein
MGCGVFKDSVVPLIESDPAVFKAELILADTYIFSRDDLIEIVFRDGNMIMVKNVNEYGKGKYMDINTVNGYFISQTNKKAGYESVPPEQNMEFYSSLLGVQLKTVMDIVKNYRAICSLVEDWIDLSDYRKDGEMIHETIRRIRSEELYPTGSIVTFNGQEYIVFKWGY